MGGRGAGVRKWLPAFVVSCENIKISHLVIPTMPGYGRPGLSIQPPNTQKGVFMLFMSTFFSFSGTN